MENEKKVNTGKASARLRMLLEKAKNVDLSKPPEDSKSKSRRKKKRRTKPFFSKPKHGWWPNERVRFWRSDDTKGGSAYWTIGRLIDFDGETATLAIGGKLMAEEITTIDGRKMKKSNCAYNKRLRGDPVEEEIIIAPKATLVSRGTKAKSSKSSRKRKSTKSNITQPPSNRNIV